MTPEDAAWLERALWALAALLCCANLALVAWRLRLKRTVGAPKELARPARKARLAYYGAAALVAALVAFSGLAVPLGPSLAVLALGVALAALAPGDQDSALGAEGVQYGWHARRFAELEEWRLTGDHLRWRLFGEWVATHAPAALHAELRTQLTSANPGRESRFQH